MKQCKKFIRRKNPTRTLANIRRIPKWERKVGFTCEEAEFDYKLITHFIRLDTTQTNHKRREKRLQCISQRNPHL